MCEHIQKLVEATKKINIIYRLAYSEKGGPDIGVRKEGNDMIIIDNIPWLIAGDIINTFTGKRITNINFPEVYTCDDFYVNLRAQAIIYGKIVQVHLGKRYPVGLSHIMHDGGTITLTETCD